MREVFDGVGEFNFVYSDFYFLFFLTNSACK